MAETAIPKFVLTNLVLQKLTGDNQSLNLGRAFVDAQRAHFSIEPLDDAVVHEARAAVDLEGLIYDAPGGFGRKQLGFASFACDALDASVLKVCGAVDQEASRVQLGRHVGQFLLNQLVLCERASELLASLRVIDRFVERAPRHAAGRRADARAKCVERLHREAETVALAS